MEGSGVSRMRRKGFGLGACGGSGMEASEDVPLPDFSACWLGANEVSGSRRAPSSGSWGPGSNFTLFPKAG